MVLDKELLVEDQRQHRAPIEETKPVNPVDAAFAQVDTWRDEEQEQHDKVERDLCSKYAALLQVDADGGDTLRGSVMELGLSQEQFEVDRRIVRKATRLTAAHAELAERNKARVAAIEAYDQVVKENRERKHTVFMNATKRTWHIVIHLMPNMSWSNCGGKDQTFSRTMRLRRCWRRSL